jgi:LCP family protein required for cell wall assembly
MWKRFLLAGAVVIVLSGVTTATAGLLEVKDIASELGQQPRLEVPEITAAQAGEPQTILLLGSDIRKADRIAKRPGRSDTMMLVRLDPDKAATAVLSIPRDLKVPIHVPPKGFTQTDKINAAYSIGGPQLVTKTIKEVLGIEINHVIDVNFKGFREAVNFVGCIYSDIDRRYFNDNSGRGPDYATIDVKPGYQKLCGQDALDYVRFRHEDSDFVRGARQQDFLRQAKDQVGVKRVLADRKEFAKLFGRYTRTDIRGTSAVLRLLKLVAFSAGHPVREVRFQAGTTLEKGVSYVVASQNQLDKTVDEFLNAEASRGPRGTPRRLTDAEKEALRRRKKLQTLPLGLENAQRLGEDMAIANAGKLSFPFYFPKVRKARSVYVDVPRIYAIRDTQGRRHAAYRIVLKTGLAGEYYGIQGMTWKDPPILDHVSEKRKMKGKELLLFFDGDRLGVVAWRTPKAVYWVSNTLLRTLDNKQMLAIAASLTTLGSPKSTSR